MNQNAEVFESIRGMPMLFSNDGEISCFINSIKLVIESLNNIVKL